MNVNPLGVRQSAPEAFEHTSHFALEKLIHGKLESVFRPDPIAAPPDVGVRYG